MIHRFVCMTLYVLMSLFKILWQYITFCFLNFLISSHLTRVSTIRVKSTTIFWQTWMNVVGLLLYVMKKQRVKILLALTVASVILATLVMASSATVICILVYAFCRFNTSCQETASQQTLLLINHNHAGRKLFQALRVPYLLLYVHMMWHKPSNKHDYAMHVAELISSRPLKTFSQRQTFYTFSKEPCHDVLQ